MVGKKSLYEKQLERIAKSFGTNLLPYFNPEEWMLGLTPEELVRGLTPEEREKFKQLLEEPGEGSDQK